MPLASFQLAFRRMECLDCQKELKAFGEAHRYELEVIHHHRIERVSVVFCKKCLQAAQKYKKKMLESHRDSMIQGESLLLGEYLLNRKDDSS